MADRDNRFTESEWKEIDRRRREVREQIEADEKAEQDAKAQDRKAREIAKRVGRSWGVRANFRALRALAAQKAKPEGLAGKFDSPGKGPGFDAGRAFLGFIGAEEATFRDMGFHPNDGRSFTPAEIIAFAEGALEAYSEIMKGVEQEG